VKASLVEAADVSSRLLPPNPLRCSRLHSKSANCSPAMIAAIVLLIGDFAPEDVRQSYRVPRGQNVAATRTLLTPGGTDGVTPLTAARSYSGLSVYSWLDASLRSFADEGAHCVRHLMAN
jgi:hypothetical protein